MQVWILVLIQFSVSGVFWFRRQNEIKWGFGWEDGVWINLIGWEASVIVR